jgi:hypothetical protein
MTPQGIGDFLPLVGTWRAAQRIDKGEPNASYADLAINAGMDLLGARMIGPVFKAASKFRNIEKGLKSRGFVKGSERAHMKNGSGTNFHKRNVEVVNDYAGKPHYFEHWGEIKTVPNVDYYNVAMQPMIQTLRVPATAPFK